MYLGAGALVRAGPPPAPASGLGLHLDALVGFLCVDGTGG